MLPENYPALARIDGQAINIASLDIAVRATIERSRAGLGFRFFTLNLDHLVKRRENAAFRSAYEAAEFVTADGMPVMVLARRQGASVIRRTTGADLVAPLCRAAAVAGIPVAFFGSDAATLERARAVLTAASPALQIAHVEAPPFGFDPHSAEADAAAERIARSGARIVLVALGAPKQELFSMHASLQHPKLGFVCVGAALDFLAGTQTRAPTFFQNTGLEWLWRLAGNPGRLSQRYAKCVAMLAALLATPSKGT